MFKQRRLFFWDSVFLVLVILILLDIVALISQLRSTEVTGSPVTHVSSRESNTISMNQPTIATGLPIPTPIKTEQPSVSI